MKRKTYGLMLLGGAAVALLAASLALVRGLCEIFELVEGR
jgi:hypothetical protein